MAPTQGDSQPELKITRHIRAPRQEVFDAWTTVESLRQWMCPEGATVLLFEVEVRVGGAFRIEMHDKGTDLVITGTYREILPPEKLVFTWVSKHTRYQGSLVTVHFLDQGETTELVLIQRRLPDEEAVRRHMGGWTTLLDQLTALLQKRVSGHRDDHDS